MGVSRGLSAVLEIEVRRDHALGLPRQLIESRDVGIIQPEQIVVSLLPQFFWQFSRFILRQERHVLHFREENQVGPCSLADKIITLLEIRFHIFGHSHLCHGKLNHSFPLVCSKTQAKALAVRMSLSWK